MVALIARGPTQSSLLWRHAAAAEPPEFVLKFELHCGRCQTRPRVDSLSLPYWISCLKRVREWQQESEGQDDGEC